MNDIKEKFKKFIKKNPKLILMGTILILLISTVVSGFELMTEEVKEKKINRTIEKMDNDVEGMGQKWKKRETIENLERQERSISAYELYTEMKRAEELQRRLQVYQQEGIKTKEDSLMVIKLYNEVQMIKNKYK